MSNNNNIFFLIYLLSLFQVHFNDNSTWRTMNNDNSILNENSIYIFLIANHLPLPLSTKLSSSSHIYISRVPPSIFTESVLWVLMLWYDVIYHYSGDISNCPRSQTFLMSLLVWVLHNVQSCEDCDGKIICLEHISLLG